MASQVDPDFQRAVTCLVAGDPVPVDVHARLVEKGFDVAAMENSYGPYTPFLFKPIQE